MSQSAKHECKDYSEKENISDLQRELNELKVKRSIERTDIYDESIKNLEGKINYFFYGIKC